MEEIKIITKGNCADVFIGDKNINESITKLELVIDPYMPPKLTLTLNPLSLSVNGKAVIEMLIDKAQKGDEKSMEAIADILDET